ncbi:MAG TPA: RNA polymerase sigma factor [Jatrophihabitantaceae bacterium]|nr:RNA polymerase sigma factor [Jatrophihabitantaceae bacterium]
MSSHAWIEGDAAIIERSVLEPEAFGALFDRHAARIHRYVSGRLGRDAADDVLAETFIAAFRRRGRYDRSRPDARPWLYGIAANVIAQHRRDEVRRWRLLAALPVDAPVSGHADDVADRVSAQAVRAQLADALAGLAGRDRDVLLLAAWADLTYEEIATALAIPVGTVRSRLFRARRLIRESLAGLNPDDTFDTNLEELLGNG